MKFHGRMMVATAALVGAFALAACGASGGAGAGAGAITIGSDGENLAYDKLTLTAPANTETRLTFKNNSTAQQHNIVIVEGDDAAVAAVDEEAINAGPPNYIPAAPAVKANTAMLAPGASEGITFTLPAGTYTYICTYPAHYAGGMVGKLTVQ